LTDVREMWHVKWRGRKLCTEVCWENL